jgi:hypothetical protein
MTSVRDATPFLLVSAVAEPAVATKSELVRRSRDIERLARQHPPPAIAAGLQDSRFLTDRTRRLYAQLAEAGCPARLHARGLQSWLAAGVAGVDLDDDHPLVDEWVIVVPGDRPVLFAATDLHDDDCPDDERTFRYAVSRDPDVVAQAARAMGL